MSKYPTTNSQGAALGIHGHVLCRTCGREEYGISRETSQEYAYCLQHRPSSQPQKETVMSDKKVKKMRTSGNPQQPIKFFQELAMNTNDVEAIRSAAEKEEYSKSTISIQIGRLRAAGLLPAAEKKERAKKEKKEPVSVRAVPKPSKRKKAA
jgi:ribosomal protein L37E